MDTAKTFRTGRSQAVRLPRAYRFDADEVSIRRDGDAVILEPLPESWAWLDRLGQVDADFMGSGRDQSAPQPRAVFEE